MPARGEPRSWPHEASGLPSDPGVTWGRLANGLRYAICHNDTPADRASLRLVVLAGSAHEQPNQRGYAHFVEHLAFDGTRLYPGQTLHAELQKQGLARGLDVNAHTHPDRTIYRLDLPLPTPARLQSGLRVLREFADGLVFDPAEVERERSVILIEKRSRDNQTQRTQTAFARFLFSSSQLADPAVLGTDESLRSATPAGLREFYDTWYRPDHLVVVVVGPFAPPELVPDVEAIFGSLREPAQPRREFDPGPLNNPPNLRVGLQRSAEVTNAASFTLAALAPAPAVETRASLRETLLRTLAFDAFNRRLAALQRREPRFTHASAGLRSGPIYQQALLRIDSSQRHWTLALRTLEQELRRATTHGFTDAEISESRERARAILRHRVESEPTRTSEELANALVESIADGRVFPTGADLAAINESLLAAATPEDCRVAFRAAWEPGHPQLFAVGDFTYPAAPEKIAKVWRRSGRSKVGPPADEPGGEFAYTSFGRPGLIVERNHVADLDLHRLRFANGVRVNLKSTGFEAGRILYGARLGRGAASEPSDQPGLRLLADEGLRTLGLGRHDQPTLSRLLASHVTALTISSGEDAFYVSGLSNRASAERLMQLITAQLADPGWRAGEFNLIRQRIVSRLDDTERNTSTFLTSHRQALLAGGDSRYRLPSRHEVLRYSLRDLRRWLEPQLDRGPLELGIVGDFDVETMVGLAARTVGCLRPRAAPEPTRRVAFADVVPSDSVLAPSTSRHGAVQLAWALPAGEDPQVDHQLELLAEVLKNRLMAQVRGELGATYAANCQIWRSDLQPEVGYLVALLTCEPGDVARIGETTRRIATTLARDGVTADEFERARQPRLQTAAVQLRTNAYWLNAVVASAQSEPQRLDLARRRISDFARTSAAELSALAARLLPAERASLFTAIPAALNASSDSEAASP